jgi:hypothetical protein
MRFWKAFYHSIVTFTLAGFDARRPSRATRRGAAWHFALITALRWLLSPQADRGRKPNYRWTASPHRASARFRFAPPACRAPRERRHRGNSRTAAAATTNHAAARPAIPRSKSLVTRSIIEAAATLSQAAAFLGRIKRLNFLG